MSSRKQRGKTLTVAIVVGLTAVAGVAAWQLSRPNLTAPEYLERGVAFAVSGDPRAALIEFKNALQRDPEYADARWQLAKLYVTMGDGAAATSALGKAQSLGVRGPEVTLTAMRASMLQAKFDDVAAHVLTDASNEQQTAYELLRAQARLGMGELDTAEAVFKEIMEREPDNQQAQLGYARVALARRDFSEGDARLKTLLAADNEAALLLKGESVLAQQEFDVAETTFRQALAKNPENPVAILGLARALIGLQNPEAALEQLTLLSSRNVNSPQVIYFTALATTQTGDFAAAKTGLIRLTNVDTPPVEGLLLLGRVHYQLEEFQQAAEMLNRVLQRAPAHLPTRKLLAATHMKLGQPANAAETLQVAIEDGTQDAQLLAMIGSAYLHSGQNAEGTRLLQQAAELAPDVAEFRTQLAVSHLVAGSFDEGVGLLESTVELDSDFAGAELVLIYAYLQQQKFTEAVKTAEKLVEKQPDSAVAYNLLGAAIWARKTPTTPVRNSQRRWN